jgi:ribosome-associated translation inhibitor RaiA
LSRFRERLTRVELHLSDENAHKGGQDDKRCMMEARIKGQQPIVVTNQAASMNEAVSGALDKLKRSVESALERLRDHR